jgi:hypothetical protein
MDAFHWIVIPISTVLGLSLARLLGGYVTAIKGRTRLRFDWLPLVFAAAILGVGLQFWWALLELAPHKDWSLSAFALLMTMIMALFAASALISPGEDDADLGVAFERNGRWALIALAVFHGLAIVANSWLWEVALISVPQALELLLAALCLVAGLVKHRRTQEAVAIAYVLLSVTDTLTASVAVY